MKKIQILGTGCPKCKQLTANVEEAVQKLGIEAEIEKVTDINQITSLGVMVTPALIVDGKIVSSGKLLSATEVVSLLDPATSDGGSTGKSESTNAPSTESCGCGCAHEEKAKTAARCCCGHGGLKGALRFILLAFVLASLAWIVVRENKLAKPQSAAETAIATKADALVVYYFHGSRRCATCMKIEELTSQAITANFADKLASGDVVFRSVNLEESGNEHFVKDFDLITNAVVMQRRDKVEKFDDIWDLAGTPEQFALYIKAGVSRNLSED